MAKRRLQSKAAQDSILISHSPFKYYIWCSYQNQTLQSHFSHVFCIHTLFCNFIQSTSPYPCACNNLHKHIQIIIRFNGFSLTIPLPLNLKGLNRRYYHIYLCEWINATSFRMLIHSPSSPIHMLHNIWSNCHAFIHSQLI